MQTLDGLEAGESLANTTPVKRAIPDSANTSSKIVHFKSIFTSTSSVSILALCLGGKVRFGRHSRPVFSSVDFRI
jgi:hypothetical protein